MRRTMALVALGTLGALIVTSDPTGPSGIQDRFVLAMWVLAGAAGHDDWRSARRWCSF